MVVSQKDSANVFVLYDDENISISGIFVFSFNRLHMKCLLAECVFLSEHESLLTQNHIKEPSFQVHVTCSKLCQRTRALSPPISSLWKSPVIWPCRVDISVCLSICDGCAPDYKSASWWCNQWVASTTHICRWADPINLLLPRMFVIAVHLNKKCVLMVQLMSVQLHTCTDELIQLICPSPLEPVSGFYCT